MENLQPKAYLIRFNSGDWHNFKVFLDQKSAEKFLNQERSKLSEYNKAYRLWQDMGDEQRSDYAKKHPRLHAYNQEQREAATKEWFERFEKDKLTLCKKFKHLLPELVYRGPVRFDLEEVDLG